MKHLKLKTFAALAVIYLSSCTKESLKPESEGAGNALQTSALATDAPDSLIVSTLYNGGYYYYPRRIGSGPKQTLYITAGRNITKISPQGVDTAFTTGLRLPLGVKAGSDGNVYVANFGGNSYDENLLYKIDSNGIKSKIMGPGGTSLAGQVYAVEDIAIADDNITLYVLNTGAREITRINNEKVFNVVGTRYSEPDYVDGVGFAARLNYPTSMKLSKSGNLYLVDDKLGFQDTYVGFVGADGQSYQSTGGRSIRKLNLATRKITTIYEATNDRHIMDIAVAKRDQYFKPSNTEGIFAVFNDNTISFISPTGDEIPLTVSANQGFKNGALKNAKFGFLTGISIHENFMEVADLSNHAIRRIARK